MNSIIGNMKQIRNILMITALVLLAACSQDKTEEQPQQSVVQEEANAPLRMSCVTRAMANTPEYGDIRIFLTN